MDKKYIKGYYRRAASNMALGKFRAALRDYETVSQASGGEPAPSFWAGRVLRAGGRAGGGRPLCAAGLAGEGVGAATCFLAACSSNRCQRARSPALPSSPADLGQVTWPLCASFPTSVRWEDSKTYLSGLP